MPKEVLTDARVEVNGVNLSAFVKSATVNTPRDKVEVTAMGATAKQFTPGLKEASIEVEFYQSYGASEVDQTLDPLSGTSTPFAVHVRRTSGAISTTNPEWRLTSALMYTYTPIAANVGEAGMTTVTFDNAGTGLTRHTS